MSAAKKETRMGDIKRMETNDRMSRIVIHNQTVYLCGQVAEDASKGIVAQTKSMLGKVDSLLEKAGSGRDLILSATIYLRDIKDFDQMNSVWDSWVPKRGTPARACVEARLADADLLVEVSVVAAITPNE